MEISLHIPEVLRPVAHFLAVSAEHTRTGLAAVLSTVQTTILPPLMEWNTLLPILAVVFIFWSLILYLLATVAGVYSFVFWIATSIIFGLLQLLYVSYQFLMIAGDVSLLSVLKTYTIMRSWVLYYVLDRKFKSRRRLWKEQLSQCLTYEDFLKVRIESKALEEAKVVDTALPAPSTRKLTRRYSFGALPPDSASPSPSKWIKRNRSFSGETWLEDEDNHTSPRSNNTNDDLDPLVERELGGKAARILQTTTQRLAEARQSAQANAGASLKLQLTGVVKRNHLNLDQLQVDNAQSIAERGTYALSNPTRSLIRSYHDEVEKGLQWLAEAPLASDNLQYDLASRMNLVRKLKQNNGRTALMLSGGGAIAMYHLGVIRALIESNIYDDIKVISGTSGGSISAAMCAIKTSEELIRDVCVPTVSTDYRRDGSMRKHNIRWFPPLYDMARYWMEHKLLVDSADFRKTCEYYYSDITFEEAFERTGKHVCITVSASRASSDTAQRLLLNHISTPHVTLASAVAASCALPGVMAPATLYSKNQDGELEPFEVDGVEWIDGSVQADLPFQRISTLFAVSSFIVSQTNFHVVPFLRKAHHPSQQSYYWRFFQHLEWDIRSRALKLSRLGLFPRIFGQDISKVFKQKYHGDLTIVPRFTTMQTLGLKALSNPTVEDMEGYLKYGQLATWPYLNAIRSMIRLEKDLDDCLAQLESRMRDMNPEGDFFALDDVDSIASTSIVLPSTNSGTKVRIIGRPPLSGTRGSDSESGKLRQKVNHLEQENERLKEQLRQLGALPALTVASDEKKLDSADNSSAAPAASLLDGAEGGVWNLVRGMAVKK